LASQGSPIDTTGIPGNSENVQPEQDQSSCVIKSVAAKVTGAGLTTQSEIRLVVDLLTEAVNLKGVIAKPFVDYVENYLELEMLRFAQYVLISSDVMTRFAFCDFPNLKSYQMLQAILTGLDKNQQLPPQRIKAVGRVLKALIDRTIAFNDLRHIAVTAEGVELLSQCLRAGYFETDL